MKRDETMKDIKKCVIKLNYMINCVPVPRIAQIQFIIIHGVLNTFSHAPMAIHFIYKSVEPIRIYTFWALDTREK